jgi:hypothetical protein
MAHAIPATMQYNNACYSFSVIGLYDPPFSSFSVQIPSGMQKVVGFFKLLVGILALINFIGFGIMAIFSRINSSASNK